MASSRTSENGCLSKTLYMLCMLCMLCVSCVWTHSQHRMHCLQRLLTHEGQQTVLSISRRKDHLAFLSILLPFIITHFAWACPSGAGATRLLQPHWTMLFLQFPNRRLPAVYAQLF